MFERGERSRLKSDQRVWPQRAWGLTQGFGLQIPPSSPRDPSKAREEWDSQDQRWNGR